VTNERVVSRRDFLRASAVVSVAGALASGTGSIERSQPKDTETDRGPYEVTMEPVGTVGFDAVPERWVAYAPGYADMGVALGLADDLAAVGDWSRYDAAQYDELDGVGFDDRPATLDGDDPADRGTFRELDADVHLVDPNQLVYAQAFDLNAADVREIADDVGPIVGNANRRRSQPWHGYRYYGLYEAFEKIAAVFRRRDRYDAFAAFHEEWLAELQAELPPASERPDALLVLPEESGRFAPLRIADRGTSTKQWRDLGVGDALADLSADELPTAPDGTVGYATIRRVDPDVLLVRGHEDLDRAAFEEAVVAPMRDHDVGGTIDAVREGRVFSGGPRHQGPILNLFATERAARAIYPDVFDGRSLFDRDRVARLVADEA